MATWQPCWISNQHAMNKSKLPYSELATCKISDKSVKRFRRRRWKCEKQRWPPWRPYWISDPHLMNKFKSAHCLDQSCEGPVKIPSAVLEKKIVKDLLNSKLQRHLVAIMNMRSFRYEQIWTVSSWWTFIQNLKSIRQAVLEKKSKMSKVYGQTDDRQTTDRRTTDRRSWILIAQLTDKSAELKSRFVPPKIIFPLKGSW